MADFPQHTKNAQVETKPLVVTAPAFNANDTRSAEEKWLDQQWRDVVSEGVEKRHPLSINRDSAKVTTDPYNV